VEVADVMTTVADAVRAVERVVVDHDQIPSRARPSLSPPLRSPKLKRLLKQQQLRNRTQLLNNQQQMTVPTRTAQQRPD
tara:strand:- start:86 stop:322 length:237 start_codon:yes stop_codon:yes gene_type:complete